jgi:hypothetical protein
MITHEKTNQLSPLPCWRKVGKKVSQIVAICSVGIVLSLESGTAQTSSSLVITSPPVGSQTSWLATKYPAAKYLKIEKYNIHILGTSTVSDWFMRESYDVLSNIVGAMKNPADRAKFSGFQAILCTNEDPDLGGTPGHRNSGGAGWSLFNEAIVRVTAVDTIRPYDAAVYRGWETPIHEFGHAVEATLNLFERTKAYHAAYGYPLVGVELDESYAWALQTWFPTASGGVRSNLRIGMFNYLSEVFDVNNTWKPTFGPRPAWQPVGPLGFTICTGEGGGYTLLSQGDVAFGANGKFNYFPAWTGGINFNVSTFGDPNYGVYKCGFYRLNSSIIPPAGYIYCSAESGTFPLSSASDVAYGSHGNFRYLHNKTGSVTFNTSTFGGDPNYGVLKGGFYKRRPSTTAPVGPTGYTWCSTENGSFTLPGVCDVAYGANGRFVYRSGQSRTVTFNNSNYGPDPIGGVVKGGFYKQTRW